MLSSEAQSLLLSSCQIEKCFFPLFVHSGVSLERSEKGDDADANEDSNDDEEDDVDSDGSDDEDDKRAAKPPMQSGPRKYTVLSDLTAEQEGDLTVQVKYIIFQRRCTHILNANIYL